MGDAGDELAFHIVSNFVVPDDQRTAMPLRAMTVIEGGEDADADLLLHRQPDRARLQHLGADAREFEHLFIGDAAELAGARDDARVGGVDAVHIGIDIAAIGADCRRDRDRRGIRTAATECGNPVFVGQTLKTGDDCNLARRHRVEQRAGVDLFDAGACVRVGRTDRHLPAEPAPRLDPHRL